MRRPPHILISGIAAALAQANVQVIGPVTPGDIPQFSSSSVIKDSGGSGGVAPSIPVIHPSSSNLVGAGCNPAQAHSLWWVDQNLCSIADVWTINSSDPSALLQFSLTGTVTSGKLQTLTFTFGAGACATGCTATYTTVGGDTLTSVVTALVAAIKANANLFNNVSGSQGQVLATQTFGSPTVNSISIDFNSTMSMKFSATDAGGTINYNIPAACATACSAAWDNNPVLSVGRNTGVAPAPNSQLFNLQVGSTSSGAPGSITIPYGILTSQVLNSTTGSIASRWAIITPDVNGNSNQGVYIGAGVYTVGVTDKGLDTINTKTYWTNGAYSFGQNASQFQFSTLATSHPFVFAVSGIAAIGVNVTPTGTLDVGGSISSLGQNFPTTGSGAVLSGTTAPSLFAQTFNTGTFLPFTFGALSWDFKPSNSATSGWTLSANSLVPDGDNVTALGSGSNRIASITSPLIAGGSGAARGDQLMEELARAQAKIKQLEPKPDAAPHN